MEMMMSSRQMGSLNAASMEVMEHDLRRGSLTLLQVVVWMMIQNESLQRQYHPQTDWYLFFVMDSLKQARPRMGFWAQHWRSAVLTHQRMVLVADEEVSQMKHLQQMDSRVLDDSVDEKWLQ